MSLSHSKCVCVFIHFQSIAYSKWLFPANSFSKLHYVKIRPVISRRSVNQLSEVVSLSLCDTEWPVPLVDDEWCRYRFAWLGPNEVWMSRHKLMWPCEGFCREILRFGHFMDRTSIPVTANWHWWPSPLLYIHELESCPLMTLRCIFVMKHWLNLILHVSKHDHQCLNPA